MTVSVTWLPPGPSKSATGRPPSSTAKAGNRRRSASTSNAGIEPLPAGRRTGKTASPWGLAVIVTGAGRTARRVSGGAVDRGLGHRRRGLRRRIGERDLVGHDLDQERDLLADEPAALLERSVPVQAPQLAIDLRPRREGDVAAALHVRGGADVLDVERHGLRHVADRNVGGDAEGVLAMWLDAIEPDDDLGPGRRVEEVR